MELWRQELYHHGILGMKWGVRRYRNEDGSLTEAGKKRYRAKDAARSMSDEELTKQVKRLTMEKQYNKLSKEAAGSQSSKLERSKKLVDMSSNMVNQVSRMNREAINNSRKKEPLDLSSMSDQQLRERINRANLERQYNDLFGKEVNTVSKGRRYTQNILEVGGSVLAIGSSALGIALAIKELRGH